MNITIEINDGGVTDALNRLLAAGEDLNPILHALGVRLKSNVERGFDEGTDPYGKQWWPLDKNLTRRGNPLVKSGLLQKSITYQVDGNSVEVGTNREHMHVHQFGAVIKAKPGKFLVWMGPDGDLIFAKRVTIPARPFLPGAGLPADWEADSIDAIAAVFQASLKA